MRFRCCNISFLHKHQTLSSTHWFICSINNIFWAPIPTILWQLYLWHNIHHKPLPASQIDLHGEFVTNRILSSNEHIDLCTVGIKVMRSFWPNSLFGGVRILVLVAANFGLILQPFQVSRRLSLILAFVFPSPILNLRL